LDLSTDPYFEPTRVEPRKHRIRLIGQVLGRNRRACGRAFLLIGSCRATRHSTVLFLNAVAAQPEFVLADLLELTAPIADGSEPLGMLRK